jgi:hypothetical protein
MLMYSEFSVLTQTLNPWWTFLSDERSITELCGPICWEILRSHFLTNDTVLLMLINWLYTEGSSSNSSWQVFCWNYFSSITTSKQAGKFTTWFLHWQYVGLLKAGFTWPCQVQIGSYMHSLRAKLVLVLELVQLLSRQQRFTQSWIRYRSVTLSGYESINYICMIKVSYKSQTTELLQYVDR